MNDMSSPAPLLGAAGGGLSATGRPSKARLPLAGELAGILCCPRCRSGLVPGADVWACSNQACAYACDGFPVAGGQPVLVDFDQSIFEREAYANGRGSVMPRDDSGRQLSTRLRRALFGHNHAAETACETLLDRLKAARPNPCVLVIGGGAVGSGMHGMYADPEITVVGTDVYASPYTSLVADGHHLPFRDGTFDAVWIQAVLEHVLDPKSVAGEIHRILKTGGLVYADTPFMQQVHEGAYDFTRFTQSGHRWLFRRFEQIDAGAVGGAGTSLLWSIRYFARALGAGRRAAMLASAPFFWLRLLDRVGDRRLHADAASGTYFLGIRADRALVPKQMLEYYAERPAGRSRFNGSATPSSAGSRRG